MNGALAGRLMAVMSLALAAGYLSAWTNMPIYPDETAIRLMSFRAIADHGIEHALTPYCTGSYSTPLPMLAFAYLLAALDTFAGWSFVRVIPLMSLLALVGAAILAMRKTGGFSVALLIPLGFVGVAGSGLILMRPECFLALQGASLFIGYSLIRSKRNSALDASWIAGSTFFNLLSIQTHPQGISLLPILIVMVVWLVVKSPSIAVRALGCLASAWIVAAAFAQASAFTFLMSCHEHPVYQSFMEDHTIFGPGAWPKFSSGLDPWIEKFHTYADRFSFKESYYAHYLPGFSHENYSSLTWLNASISAAVQVNLALAVVVIIGASFQSARLLFQRKAAAPARLAAFFGAGSTFLAVGGAALLLPLLIDPLIFFYRCHFTHLALVLVNAAALSTLQFRRHALLAPVYCVAVALCLQSTVITSRDIDPQFVSGWEGPSLSLGTDWSAVSAKVSHLAKACGITHSQERIVIDDLTFTALRDHPHLLSLSYMWQARAMIEPSTHPMSPVRKLGTALLVRCEVNFGPNIPAGIMRDGDLCCANFE
jgi:hypothetical protein